MDCKEDSVIVRFNFSIQYIYSFVDFLRVMRRLMFAVLLAGLIIPALFNLAVSDSGPSKPVIHSFEASPVL